MPEEWLIDGYNLLHALNPREKKNTLSRDRFMCTLSSFASAGKRQVIVYLDGVGNNDEWKSYETDCFRVEYSQDKSADTLIEKRLFERRNQSRFMVVTEDRSIANIARGAGASVLSGAIFLQYLNESKEASKDILHKEKVYSHGFHRPFEKKLKDPK